MCWRRDRVADGRLVMADGRVELAVSVLRGHAAVEFNKAFLKREKAQRQFVEGVTSLLERGITVEESVVAAVKDAFDIQAEEAMAGETADDLKKREKAIAERRRTHEKLVAAVKRRIEKGDLDEATVNALADALPNGE